MAWNPVEIGTALGLRDRVRAHYAERFGVCRDCGEPLAGPSPEQVCTDCHANEALGMALGGEPGGEA